MVQVKKAAGKPAREPVRKWIKTSARERRIHQIISFLFFCGFPVVGIGKQVGDTLKPAL